MEALHWRVILLYVEREVETVYWRVLLLYGGGVGVEGGREGEGGGGGGGGERGGGGRV